MRFQFPDGQIVMMDQAFSRDGVNYPAEWLRQMTPEARAEWGLTELPEPEAPNTPAPAPAPRWPPLQFIERFTEAEQIAIVTAAQTSPALRLWYDKAMASQEVVSDDPRTVAGMDALVAAGLISEARRSEILGA